MKLSTYHASVLTACFCYYNKYLKCVEINFKLEFVFIYERSDNITK